VRPLRVLTWHVHGSYLYYLSHVEHELFIPVLPGDPAGYCGLPASFPWRGNVHEVPAPEVRQLQFDCVLFQSHKNYAEDRFAILSPEQRRLPSIFLEHDPPRGHPTDTRHPVDDPDVVLVHVTHFNALMWDSGRTPVRVIEHGVVDPGIRYGGQRAAGAAVINNLPSRGRRLGLDLFRDAQRQVPLDLMGMDSEGLGGLGDVSHDRLLGRLAEYRFFFNPIRYTSLGLAVCEAMMVGLPIVGLATTETVTVVENGVSGYLDTDPQRLVEHMRRLLDRADEARELGAGARKTALRRFGMDRFVRDWEETLAAVTGNLERRATAAIPTVGVPA